MNEQTSTTPSTDPAQANLVVKIMGLILIALTLGLVICVFFAFLSSWALQGWGPHATVAKQAFELNPDSALAQINHFTLSWSLALGVWAALCALTTMVIAYGLPTVTIFGSSPYYSWMLSIIATIFFIAFGAIVWLGLGIMALGRAGDLLFENTFVPLEILLFPVPITGIIWTILGVWELVFLLRHPVYPDQDAVDLKVHRRKKRATKKAMKAASLAAKKGRG